MELQIQAGVTENYRRERCEVTDAETSDRYRSRKPELRCMFFTYKLDYNMSHELKPCMETTQRVQNTLTWLK